KRECSPLRILPARLTSRFLCSRMHFTLHATRPIPRGSSRLVQAMSTWSVKTRRAPSRHCRDAGVYGHTTKAMHDTEYTPRRSLFAISEFLRGIFCLIYTRYIIPGTKFFTKFFAKFFIILRFSLFFSLPSPLSSPSLSLLRLL
ncbi:unnamed protein product, partial [Laminaria digitata]